MGMVNRVAAALGLSSPARDERAFTPDFAARMQVLNKDPYLLVADEQLRIISVFDDLKFDRADMDMLSGPMRRRALQKLAPLGFRQVSGTVLENRADNIRAIMPKFRALGESPFDATRYTERRPQDWFILTPTQAACMFIDTYPHMDAVERIKALVVKQPINLYRIMDYLERKPAHEGFRPAIGHLKYVQRTAVEAEPLRSRRALR
ncbi:hypothetical protein PSA7680_02201 [Pseudoruegeria aquimaris]|uniref:Uncharacterized protein n=1 Tax=Pseudoruegeria aquimaris TaxID=393663 RepID=A0A1Y5SRI7_9RHOB|nr:hypothetical protein [Pseudoruegeria aquimaris]SLN43625.1 hypothetical protein PSA7680_02201 [Pseudoruegeria aquimaris]